MDSIDLPDIAGVSQENAPSSPTKILGGPKIDLLGVHGHDKLELYQCFPSNKVASQFVKDYCFVNNMPQPRTYKSNNKRHVYICSRSFEVDDIKGKKLRANKATNSSSTNINEDDENSNDNYINNNDVDINDNAENDENITVIPASRKPRVRGSKGVVSCPFRVTLYRRFPVSDAHRARSKIPENIPDGFFYITKLNLEHHPSCYLGHQSGVRATPTKRQALLMKAEKVAKSGKNLLLMDLIEVHRDGVPVGFKVILDVPGVPKSALDISFSPEESSITIEISENRSETQGFIGKSNVSTVSRERHVGTVTRTINVPEACDLDSAKAIFENGILTLEFERKFSNPRKKIKIF